MKWVLSATSSSGNSFLITEPITLNSIWVIFFGIFFCSPALATINQRYLAYFLSKTFISACRELPSLPTLLTQIAYNCRCNSVCIDRMHRWLHQFCCTLNKDTGSNDDDWLKYPIILFVQFCNPFPHSSFSGGHVSAIFENPNAE